MASSWSVGREKSILCIENAPEAIVRAAPLRAGARRGRGAPVPRRGARRDPRPDARLRPRRHLARLRRPCLQPRPAALLEADAARAVAALRLAALELDLIPYIVAHEIIHFLQPEGDSLLKHCLREGSAEWVGSCPAVHGCSPTTTRIDREFHRTGEDAIVVTAKKIHIVIAIGQWPVTLRVLWVV
jgi:hypothetical protein